MRLYIVRHGEAHASAPSDELRCLTERGEREVAVLWRQLKAEGIEISEVVASPYVRAQQTAAQIAECYPNVSQHTCSLITPDDSPENVIEWLASRKGSLDGWVLVSHMPLVAALTGLITEGIGSRAAFAVGTVACIDLEVPCVGGGRLLWQRSPVR
ncbi:MAG: phosphohistidine phosphatase SixA [Gammaproteobacteria bacterium]|nr:phosphohistidine phosphatase SixA [Gammaproteobacteria bacterium]MBQ0773843.1 phosphohistidine phosphatase SixA [Gammaproteobacteria bacterium]